MEHIAAILIGFVLDLIFGDPVWLYHPVRIIGHMISGGEKLARRIFPETDRGKFVGGMVMSICVILLSGAVPFFLLWGLSLINPWLAFVVECFFCYQILATKCLKTESMRVYDQLAKGDLVNARKYLSWIVGRDTENLTEEQVTKAAVETVAENASDGVIAPMFYMFIGGAPLAFLYKAINTLDSMVGYKNDKYLFFGRFAAKTDDVFNFIPAALSGLLMVLSSFFCGLNGKNAWRIWKRDRYNHSSPNSAKTEAACAGALEVQLAGDAVYFGKLVKKKTIGDPIRKIQISDIKRANRLLYTTAVVSLVIFSLVTMLILFFYQGGFVW